MAFNIHYLHCSSETQAEISSVIEQWQGSQATYEVKTSGSTGTPKLITLLHEQLEASARRSNAFFNLDEHARVLMCLSPHTIGGKMMLIRAIVGNYAIDVAEASGNPENHIPSQVNYSFVSLVPYQIKRMLDENPEKLDQFDQILLGGMGLSGELEQKLSALKPTVYIGFGMTETVSHIAMRKIGSPVYKALNGVTLQPEGDCLVISDSQLGIREMKTNDQIRFHGPNRFEWLGRADFVINSAGIKIHPEALEQVIDPYLSVPFIIGGVPDPSFGERCTLITEQVISEADFARIQTVVGEKFGKFSIPRQQIIHPILKTANGKIRRKEILNALK
ncbi:AMP-binding protein [Fluviicola sp.]|jgi:O-succinylbenzoic acid--CoA ligase|uniref:AMP-binding protein n=1 Tax=Fluviicola sp. TaxID=1917219 RepID=UPI0028338718|nr:AMP-binding protein [Fluviicola sp.]MDR0801793.1 AMP-binding protein [Fluviicola sp.]